MSCSLMLSQEAKDLFEALAMLYPAIALKYHFMKPRGVDHVGAPCAFCALLRHAQDGHHFYMGAEDDECFGKMVLGMADLDPLAASGQAGFDFGVFRTQAANARLYEQLPTLKRGAHNFVEFCPVSECDFDPDLVICVAETDQADILMRATSYISGDLWEAKTSCVLSCAWLYAYPYKTGKVNSCITGMHHGLKRRKLYPAGLHMISIPFQKLDEVITALGQMDWVPIAMRSDEESRAELTRRMEGWQEMQPGFDMRK
jgi:uncharacterized protein (DUF169 family)